MGTDEPNKSDDKPTSGKTVEELQAELDALKTKADKSDYFKSEMDKIIKQRDELKGKLKEREDKELIDKGNLQEALDKKIKELEEAKAETEPLKQKAEEWENYLKTKREELIKKLSNDEQIQIAGQIGDLVQLEKFVEMAKPAKAPDVDSQDGMADKDIKLTDEQKKEADLYFRSIDDPKERESAYIDSFVKIKKKD